MDYTCSALVENTPVPAPTPSTGTYATASKVYTSSAQYRLPPINGIPR